MSKAKLYFLNGIFILVSSFANFIVFLEAYKRLSLPFINEEQKVENAPYIFLYVLPCFLMISALLFIFYKIIMKKLENT